MGYYYTTSTFAAAALMVVVLVGGHLRASLGAICGTTPATDQAAFGTYVEDLLQDLVKHTASKKANDVGVITYNATNPEEGGAGSAIGTGTCYDQGDKTVKDCKKCLGQVLPYLRKCETTSAHGGAVYEGRCMLQFWEVTAPGE